MNNTKFQYISSLRALACFSVILLHYSGSYTYRFGVPTFNQGILVFTVTRFCVPIFVMISGALLLEKNITIGTFYKKRLFRIFPPFLFWSSVYLIFKYASGKVELNNFYDLFLNKGVEFHFWYVYMILGLILFIPFLTHWTEKKETKSLKIFIAIWVLWSLITYTFPNYMESKGLSYLSFSYFKEFIGFLVLGYYLHIRENSKYDWVIGLFLFLFSAVYGYLVSIEASYEAKKFVQYFLNYKSWNVIIMSSGVFMLAKHIRMRSSFFKFINEISKYSFGIYLAHIIVRDTLVVRYFDFLNFETYSFLIIKSIIVLIFSYIIVKSINKIPYLGKYISG